MWKIVRVSEISVLYIYCPCDARFNQNSYVNYKIDNKNK